MALGKTASLYRHGGETAGGTIYNYATETTTNITNVIQQSGGESIVTPSMIPTTTLAAGDYIRARFSVPAGYVLKVWQAGVHDSNWAAPDGLDCWLRVESQGAETLLASSTRETAVDNPLASVTGAEDVAFQLENGTAASVDASGYFSYTLEETA